MFLLLYKMTAQISFRPDEKLQYVYQARDIVYAQTLEPQNKRFDTLQPTNAQQAQDSFLLQQPQDYFNLRIKKKDVFKVTVTAKTTEPAANNVGTSPALLILGTNAVVDNFALTKMTQSVSIKWGNNTLESTRDDRNPWLYEMKSAQFDLPACRRFGLEPLVLSGIGDLNGVLSPGAISVPQLAQKTNGFNVPPLVNPNFSTIAQLAKEIENMGSTVRTRILGDRVGEQSYAPVFTDLAAAPVALTASNTNIAFYGQWVPLDGANPFYNPTEGVKGVYYVEVVEYIMDDFLTTPYQKNSSEKCVKITPATMINFNFGYDEKYIKNGLIKWCNSNASPDQSITVERQPAESKITLQTFTVTTPPPADYSMKILTFRPTRLEARSVTLANGASSTVEIYDQSDTVLPPFLILSADPEAYTGDQSSAYDTTAPQQAFTNFFPAKITACEIQIGQSTVTENISIDDLYRMSADVMRNQELANWTSGNGQFTQYAQNVVDANILLRNKGCPFLVIDLGRLALGNSRDCSQMLPNVDYATPQTMKIKMTIHAQDYGIISRMIYYPHVYKFYPYVYEQTAGRPMTKTRLEIGFADASSVVNNANVWNGPEMDLTMVGNGWFDDVRDFVTHHASSVGKALLKGIRMGEEWTRDKRGLEDVNYGLRTVSDVAHHFGHGNARSRASAIKK